MIQQLLQRMGAAFVAALLASAAPAAERFQLVWPTPNRAWAEGKPASQWLQHAGSGDPDSGGFGGVRSGGGQFHEGIDIKAVSRDRRGEPLDSVLAAMPGIVRHVSSAAGDSSYGRYVVLEHPTMSPALYTLYAHLARIAPGLRAGQQVPAGQVLGTMGHSSGGYMIPTDRAHLHFEIGLVVSQNFQSWYDSRRFGSRNDHGIWNGMNLIGIDPIAFFNEWRGGRLTTAQEFFGRMETAVRVRVSTYRTPDFITRYPALLTKPMPLGPVAGWDIRFNWTGLPFAWTPLSGTEVVGLPAGQPRIVEVNAALERKERSRTLAVDRRGTWTVGKDLETVLQLLFGFK
jgi:peptidoglycan LD-endopeptidase LytH